MSLINAAEAILIAVKEMQEYVEKRQLENDNTVNIRKFGKIENKKQNSADIINKAIEYCRDAGKTLVFNNAVYYYDGVINIDCSIEGNGASFARYNYGKSMTTASEFSITIKNAQNIFINNLIMSDENNNYDDSDYEGYNSKFGAESTSEHFGKIGVLLSNNVKFTNCKFDGKMPDLYNGAEFITFENCTFIDVYDKTAGGLWIRSLNKPTHNVLIHNCNFYKRGADEMIACWGWLNNIYNVIVDSCYFSNESTETNKCNHFITLCQSGNSSNIKFTNNTFDMMTADLSIMRAYYQDGKTNENIVVQGNTFNIYKLTKENFSLLDVTVDNEDCYSHPIFSQNVFNIHAENFGSSNYWLITRGIFENNIVNVNSDITSNSSLFGKRAEVRNNTILAPNNKIRVAFNTEIFQNNIVKAKAGSNVAFQFITNTSLTFTDNIIEFENSDDSDARWFFYNNDLLEANINIKNNTVKNMKLLLNKVSNVVFTYNQWNSTNIDITGVTNIVRHDNFINGKIDISLKDVRMYPVLSTETGVVNIAYKYGDVRRYGATGDGITNDSTAILNALNSYHDIYIPTGIYSINRMVKITTDKRIIGDGKSNSILKFNEHIENRVDDYLFKIDCDNFTMEGMSLIYETTTVDDVENLYVENEGIICKITNIRKQGYFNDCSFETLNNGTTVKMTPFWLRNNEDTENVVVTNCNFINTNKTQAGGALWVSPSSNGYLKSLIVSNCYFYHTNADETIAIWTMSATAGIGNILFENNSIFNENTDHNSDNILSVNGSSDDSLITIQNNNFHCNGEVKCYFKFLGSHVYFTDNKIYSNDEIISSSYFIAFLSIEGEDVNIIGNMFKVTTTGTISFNLNADTLIKDNIFNITAFNYCIQGKTGEYLRFQSNTIDLVSTRTNGSGININTEATIIFEKNTFLTLPRITRSISDKPVKLKFIDNHFKSFGLLFQAAIESLTIINNICDEMIAIYNTNTTPSGSITMIGNFASSYVIQYNWANITDETVVNVADKIVCADNRTYDNGIYEYSYEKSI